MYPLREERPDRAAHDVSARAPGGDPLIALHACATPAEEELSDLLRRQTGAVEEGLRVVEESVPCEGCDPIDLIAVDRTDRLSIIDFDVTPTEVLPLRAMSHADWVVRNVPILRRMCQGQVVDFSLEPRLFLIAPRFSPMARRAARHITCTPIDLLTYRAVAVPNGTGIHIDRVGDLG